jgi:hypothetical protein
MSDVTPDPVSSEAREGLREARAHIEQAFEWHRLGTRPTGQSVELRAALDAIDRALVVTPAPDSGAEERLRAALKQIADGDLTARNPREIARAALHDSAPSGTTEEEP